MTQPIRIGTRGSELALRQTALVADALRRGFPQQQFEVVVVRSEGDRRPDEPIPALGRGAFVSQLEEALSEERIDLAVHSLKDLPTDVPSGLVVVPVLKRADPRDALVDRWGLSLHKLPAGARVGTSSLRREAQLRLERPDLTYLPIRGNVETRVAKTTAKEYDGAILAAAGLIRLGLEGHVAEYLSPEVCTPAPGQGALALEVRSDDAGAMAMAQELQEPETTAAVEAERWVLRAAGGGCQVPIGALAVVDGTSLRLAAAAVAADGSAAFRVEVSWPAGDPQGAGRAAYEALLEQGADKLMAGEPAP